jgi:hypothetical protein
MMTSDEALSKTCHVDKDLCHGSACMAWRWAHKKGDFVPTEIVRDLHGEKITYKIAEHSAGFCGLAGPL